MIGGRLALRPNNCALLGGKVDALVATYRARENLSEENGLASMRALASRQKPGGPPPFVGFTAGSTAAGDRTNHADTAARGSLGSIGLTVKSAASESDSKGKSSEAGALASAGGDTPPAPPIARVVPSPGQVLPAFQRVKQTDASAQASTAPGSPAASQDVQSNSTRVSAPTYPC